jgi:putative PIN family toxin of toxin-antitoxin system
MPVRAVLDTNVYVSALFSAEGPSGQVFDAGFRDKGFVPVVSPFILAELADVLTRPANIERSKKTIAELAVFHNFVATTAERISGNYQDLDIVPRDVRDSPVAATALEADVDYLVSLDDDLLSLKALRQAGHRPVQIIEPSDFLKTVLRR